jgi:DNA primase small subunit
MNVSDYYMTAPLGNIPRYNEREFCIVVRGKYIRHLAFSSVERLRAFLIEHYPEHVYYSSAYYNDPGAPKMNLKGWKGADLVFDIDYDKLKRATLKEARRQTFKLVSILRHDFGFDPKDIEVRFSGNRGYHVVVYGPCIIDMRKAERKEIADYFLIEKRDDGKPNKNHIRIDAQVTVDTSRLIRLPGSLHGKSNKPCAIIPYQEWDIVPAPNCKIRRKIVYDNGRIEYV